MNDTKNIMIVTSGTGGHIFPAMLVADQLKILGWNIFWIAPFNRLESTLLLKKNIQIEFIKISSFRKKNIKELLLIPFNFLKTIFQVKILINKYRPNIVLGMGGYVSGPVVFTAWLCKIPTIIHEQNFVAGLTNKFLAKIAKKVLQAFPKTLPGAIVVGNPIRKDILNLLHPKKRLNKRFGFIKILVTGGSQGSDILNMTFPKVVSKLKKKVFVWHQTGKNKKDQTKDLYKRLCNKLNIYKIEEFINNMSKAYSWADLIICRSGALTVSEILSVGLAAFFIPYKHKDNQQILNANILSSIGGAKIFKEKNLTKTLIDELNKISHKKLLKMAKRSHRKFFSNSTKHILKIIVNFLK